MSRRTMPYHRRYHGDALTGYMTLTLEERGAYTTLLDLMYDMAGPIPDDRRWLSGHLGCSMRKVDALIPALIEKGKIHVTSDGKLSNRRVEQELDYSLTLSRTNAENRLKAQRKKTDRAEMRNENNATAKRSLNDRFIIPEPEPDIIENSEYDAACVEPEERSEPVPIRHETFHRETVADRLVRADALPTVSAESGRRLDDALNRRTASRWPVPSRGFKPTR